MSTPTNFHAFNVRPFREESVSASLIVTYRAIGAPTTNSWRDTIGQLGFDPGGISWRSVVETHYYVCVAFVRVRARS
jgi:hypothetical protein